MVTEQEMEELKPLVWPWGRLVDEEKMVTVQEVEELKPFPCPWDRLVEIQCTKPPNVMKRTAELMAEVGCHVQGKQLKGQRVCTVCCCFSLVMCYLQ